MAKKDKTSILTFIVFIAISAMLWFLIKLTKDYSTQTVFLVRYTAIPANKWIPASEQKVKLTFVADGFVTLKHNMIRHRNRMVEIPLDEVPYRLESGYTYSYSSQYVVERVANWLGIPASNVSINDDKQYFNMEDLQSKELSVVVPMRVQPQRQYKVYGSPTIQPAKVTVYGPQNILDTLNVVYTEQLRAENVSEDFEQVLGLDFYDGAIRSEVDKVTVKVDLERFTELDVEVPVTIPDTLTVRFFPETMTVKCMVAIKDYGVIKPTSFVVEADTAQLHQRNPLLNIRLVSIPPQVQVLKTEPDKVEYLIMD